MRKYTPITTSCDGDMMGLPCAGENVVGGQHQHVQLGLGFDRQWQVDRHLVTIEVRVVAGAHQGVQSDGVAFHKHGFEGEPMRCKVGAQFSSTGCW